MITLHRLGHTDEPFQLNPDLIVTVESTPDTVVTLATTAKVVVAESPERGRRRGARAGAWRCSRRRCATAGPRATGGAGHSPVTSVSAQASARSSAD